MGGFYDRIVKIQNSINLIIYTKNTNPIKQISNFNRIQLGVSDIAKSKKSLVFLGYKRFTKIKLQTLPNHFNFNKTLSIKTVDLLV